MSILLTNGTFIDQEILEFTKTNILVEGGFDGKIILTQDT